VCELFSLIFLLPFFFVFGLVFPNPWLLLLLLLLLL